jgi:Tol biopolymer transport system component
MRKLLALGVAASMAATAVIGGAAIPAGATYAGPNGRILFDHCDELTGCQIYTVNPDGSSLQQVTTEGDNFSGDWSPDGTKIAYVSTVSGDVAIWLANADGSDAVQLTLNQNRSDTFWPRFSPNGRHVLYVDCLGFDCDGGLYSVRLDGTHRHAVTPNSGNSFNVGERSPNGDQLAYMRWHVNGVKMGVYVSDRYGANEQLITPPRLEGSIPDWAPSGESVLFTTNIFFDRPNVRLYSVHPDGSELSLLTDNGFRIDDWDGAYSPDGRKIVFDSDRDSGCYGCGDLFIMTSDGAHMWRVRLPMDAYDARWGTAPLSTVPSDPVAARRVVPAAPFRPWQEVVGFSPPG